MIYLSPKIASLRYFFLCLEVCVCLFLYFFHLKISVYIKGKDGVTALGLACLRGDRTIVTKLLNRPEININIRYIPSVVTCKYQMYLIAISNGEKDPDAVIFRLPDPVVFSTDSVVFPSDPVLTCCNRCIK